jgi:hypothetical protein
MKIIVNKKSKEAQMIQKLKGEMKNITPEITINKRKVRNHD